MQMMSRFLGYTFLEASHILPIRTKRYKNNVHCLNNNFSFDSFTFYLFIVKNDHL